MDVRAQSSGMDWRGKSLQQLSADARIEASHTLRELAARICAPRDPVKTKIECLAADLGWTYRRVFDLWYGRARTVRSWEMDILRAYLQERWSMTI